MLFLLIQLGNDRYALESGQIVEVLPLLTIKKLPQSPTGVAGVMNYRGVPVPVLDLSELAMSRPSRLQLSTRIIVVEMKGGQSETRLLGLITERATETWRKDPAEFVSSGITNDATPYLGPVFVDSRGIVQWIEPATLLPASLYELLFKQSAEASWQALSS